MKRLLRVVILAVCALPFLLHAQTDEPPAPGLLVLKLPAFIPVELGRNIVMLVPSDRDLVCEPTKDAGQYKCGLLVFSGGVVNQDTLPALLAQAHQPARSLP